MSIIISKKRKNAQVLEKSDFERENDLQDYIHNNPESIPIYELQEDKKLFVAKREFPTNSGPIDALAVDIDGNLYVIETKLFKNPDKRTVVAQALDYGAALWKHYTNFNQFLNILDQESQNRFALSFEDKLKEFYEIDVSQVNELISQLQENLNNGNIKFVILMDSIEERLRNLILYVNQNSDFDVYAVQLDYYKFEDYEIVIPKIFGLEVKKKTTRSVETKKWDENSWFNEFKKSRTISEFNIVKNFFDWAKDKSLKISYSSLRIDARATLWVSIRSSDSLLFGFRMDGNIEFRFINLKKHPPFDKESKRRELARKLNEIPNINISDKKSTLRGYPAFSIEVLKNNQVFDQFCKIIDWCIKTSEKR